MMRALVEQSWRQTLGQWPRTVLALAALILPLVEQALSASSSLVDAGKPWLPLVMLVSTCSIEARSGLQRAILGRPVSRFTYVLSRWIAGASLVTGLQAAQLVASFALAALVGADEPPPLRFLALTLVATAQLSMVWAAWFTTLSALLPVLGDLGLLAVLVLAQQAADELLVVGREVVVPILGLPLAFLIPSPAAMGHRMGAMLWGISSVAAMLAVGIVLFSRRQIPGGPPS